jgi:hypothetical protein
VFHADRSTSNSTWLGPVSETYSISPAGSGPYPFQDNAATIYTIANTGAMLIVGQKRSREPTALTAEPRCTSDSNSRRDNPRPSSFLTKSLTLITTLKAWPLLIAAFCRLDKSLSCCWEKGWLVGAVGIEFIKAQNPKELCGMCGSRKSFVV